MQQELAATAFPEATKARKLDLIRSPAHPPILEDDKAAGALRVSGQNITEGTETDLLLPRSGNCRSYGGEVLHFVFVGILGTLRYEPLKEVCVYSWRRVVGVQKQNEKKSAHLPSPINNL